MNYRKIDAPLNAALSESTADAETLLTVFIHAVRDLNQKEAAELRSMGIDRKTEKGRIITATLPPAAIDKLSDKTWVKSIRLSQKLKPRDDD